MSVHDARNPQADEAWRQERLAELREARMACLGVKRKGERVSVVRAAAPSWRLHEHELTGTLSVSAAVGLYGRGGGRMHTRDFDGFSGSLRSLLELCAEHLPAANVLEEAQDKLLEEIDAANAPLLVRRYGKHHRGMLVAAPGSPSFYPVDNEPLVGFYDHLGREGTPTRTVFELIEGGQIPLSWSLAPAAPVVPYKVGPAAARFREAGLKLAHLVDCGRGVPDGPDAVRVRAFRTMSPVNIFPFPSPRRWEVKIEGGRVTAKDPTEDPVLQALMAAFIAHHLREHSQAVATWRLRCFADAPSIVDLSEAESIQVTIRKKEKKSRSGGAPPGSPPAGSANGGSRRPKPEISVEACRKYGRSEELEGLDDLVRVLRDWRLEQPSAQRLDGLAPGTKNGRNEWVCVRLEFPADAFSMETPEGVRLDGSAFTGRYCLNGDVTISAIDELLRLYDADQPVELVFRPRLTDAGTRCLNLASAQGVDGFYCYRI